MELTGQHSTLYKINAKIYGLYDLDGNIFYVGCTIQPLAERLKNHLRVAKNSQFTTLQKSNRIRECSFEVEIKELDSILVTGPSIRIAVNAALKLEDQWICKMLRDGHDLTNKITKLQKKAFNKSDAFHQNILNS